ncbi:MAG TPA: discoidin domain-containing protein [Abditibacterium sp.]|jgi:hypothetical protein
MKPSYSLSLLAALFALCPAASHAQNRVLSTDLTNIAAAQNGGRVLSVTSTLNNDKTYASSNLIDGQAFNFATNKGSKGWASNQFDSTNMDMVTLGFAGNSTHKIGKIVLNPAIDLTPERWAKDVEVQVSTDTAEGPYTPIAQLTLKREATAQEFTLLPVEARFVRLMFRTNWGSDRAVGLGEIEIYDAIDTSDPMGSLIARLEAAVVDLRRFQQTQSEGGAAPSPRGAAVPAAAQPAKNGRQLAGATLQMVQLMGGDAARPTANRNIAAAKNGGKIMGYSSTYNADAQYGPDKLIDGQNYRPADDKGTFGWASQGFAPGKEYVTVGFADDRTHLIGRVTLNPVSNQSDLRWARRVEVQVTSGSFRDGPWRSAALINLRPDPVNQDFTIRPTEAKYVRFVFQANGPGVVLPNADPNVNSDRAVSLGEIEIYEAVAGNDQLEALIGRFNQVLVDLKTLRRRGAGAGAPAETTGAALVTPAALAANAPRATPAKTSAKTTAKPAKKNAADASDQAPSGRLVKNG